VALFSERGWSTRFVAAPLFTASLFAAWAVALAQHYFLFRSPDSPRWLRLTSVACFPIWHGLVWVAAVAAISLWSPSAHPHAADYAVAALVTVLLAVSLAVGATRRSWRLRFLTAFACMAIALATMRLTQ